MEVGNLVPAMAGRIRSWLPCLFLLQRRKYGRYPMRAEKQSGVSVKAFLRLFPDESVTTVSVSGFLLS